MGSICGASRKKSEICAARRVPNVYAEKADYLWAVCRLQAVRYGSLKWSNPSFELSLPLPQHLISGSPKPRPLGGFPLEPAPLTAHGERAELFPQVPTPLPRPTRRPLTSCPCQAAPGPPLHASQGGRRPASSSPGSSGSGHSLRAELGWAGVCLCSCSLDASKPGGGRRAGPRRARQSSSP